MENKDTDKLVCHYSIYNRVSLGALERKETKKFLTHRNGVKTSQSLSFSFLFLYLGTDLEK